MVDQGRREFLLHSVLHGQNRGSIVNATLTTRERVIEADLADTVGHSKLCQCPACERIGHRAWLAAAR